MLKDLVPLFKKEREEHPNLVRDNYGLKEGVYFRFDLGRSFEENITKPDFIVQRKKEEGDIAKKGLMDWFRVRDYYSSVLNDDLNKAVDIPARKIHCTNGLTLFVKKDVLLEEKDGFTNSRMYDHIQTFYQHFLNQAEDKLLSLYPTRAKKKAEKELEFKERQHYFETYYSSLLDHLYSEERNDFYQQAQLFWKDHFFSFLDFLRAFDQQRPFSNYVKVFFSADEAFYEKEYVIYLMPRIFNANKYNVLENGKILGLPACDVSMNAKMPFLELKTRKTPVSTRVSLDEAMAMKDLYTWLENKGKMKEFTLSVHTPFSPRQPGRHDGLFHLRLDGSGGLDYYEQVPFSQREQWDVVIENVLKIEEKEKDGDGWHLKTYDTIQSAGSLHGHLSRLFFANRLSGSFLHMEVPKVKEHEFTGTMQSVFVMTRQAIYDFLYKGTEMTIRPFLEKYARILIEEQLLKTAKGLRFHLPAEAFLLRLALKKFVGIEGGEEMAAIIRQTYETLNEKLNQDQQVVECESKEEFCFLAGQLGYYLLSQSKAHQKDFGLAEPILRAKNAQQLKRKIEELFDTYKHTIALGHIRFKIAFSMLAGSSYDEEVKIEGRLRDLVLAGLMAKNLFFETQKEGKSNG